MTEEHRGLVVTDQHEFNLMADEKSSYVRINLGTYAQFMALDKWDARRFAERLIDAANELPDPDIH